MGKRTNSSFHVKLRTTGKVQFLFFRRFLLVLRNFLKFKFKVQKSTKLRDIKSFPYTTAVSDLVTLTPNGLLIFHWSKFIFDLS